MLVGLDRSSLFSLQGKVALLTGASGFLGRTFAETLLANGAELVAIGRPAKLAKQQQLWSEKYGPERVHCYFVDMYDLEALAKTLDEIAARHAIDVLINNAHELAPSSGFNTPAGSLEQGTIDVWMRNLTAGVCWPALTVQRIGAGMKERGRGSIINISTMYALVAPRPALYEGTDVSKSAGIFRLEGCDDGLHSLCRFVLGTVRDTRQRNSPWTVFQHRGRRSEFGSGRRSLH